jgi:hypothetical protein
VFNEIMDGKIEKRKKENQSSGERVRKKMSWDKKLFLFF